MTGWTYLAGWGFENHLEKNNKDEQYRSFEAQCFPLYSLLKAINVTTVDYFSLDVEGAELSILKTIPWHKDLVIKVSNEFFTFGPHKIALINAIYVYLAQFGNFLHYIFVMDNPENVAKLCKNS
jgi:hypothetical protein